VLTVSVENLPSRRMRSECPRDNNPPCVARALSIPETTRGVPTTTFSKNPVASCAVEKTYIVQLELTFTAENPQEAAQGFFDWLDSTMYRTVTVTDESTGVTTSHDI